MKYSLYDHRHAKLIVTSDQDFVDDYNEIINVIEGITDEDLINQFRIGKEGRASTKSLSDAINLLLKQHLENLGWESESSLFKEPPYNKGNRSRWRLDFAKNNISIEVAFNHQEATAHNILKPVLASELNHVKKDIQTKIGVIITATEAMKKAGNFDSAIGTFEKFIEYFRPYNVIITTPIVLLGLEPPESFKINKQTKKVVEVVKNKLF